MVCQEYQINTHDRRIIMAFDRKLYRKNWDRKRNEKSRKLIQRWKQFKGCSVCGYKEHFAALSLDHINPTEKHQTKGLYRAINHSWGKERLKQELSKCRVLCLNCHGIRSYTDEHHSHRRK